MIAKLKKEPDGIGLLFVFLLWATGFDQGPNSFAVRLFLNFRAKSVSECFIRTFETPCFSFTSSLIALAVWKLIETQEFDVFYHLIFLHLTLIAEWYSRGACHFQSFSLYKAYFHQFAISLLFTTGFFRATNIRLTIFVLECFSIYRTLYHNYRNQKLCHITYEITQHGESWSYFQPWYKIVRVLSFHKVDFQPSLHLL